MTGDGPFILIFACENPWEHLRNIVLPDDFVALSGLRGLKRKRGDKETLLVAERSPWIRVREESLSFSFAPPVPARLRKVLPVPALLGRLRLGHLRLLRDRNLLMPLYVGRLDDGFVISPNARLVSRLTGGMEAPEMRGLEADFASVRFRSVGGRGPTLRGVAKGLVLLTGKLGARAELGECLRGLPLKGGRNPNLVVTDYGCEQALSGEPFERAREGYRAEVLSRWPQAIVSPFMERAVYEELASRGEEVLEELARLVAELSEA